MALSRLEYQRAWRAKNLDKQLAYHRDYWKNKMNPETKKRKLKRAADWQKSHPEYAKLWVKNNLGRLAKKRAKRRSLLNSRLHPDANQEFIATFYITREQLTEQTLVKHEVDHIIPLAHGGFHHEDNLQVIPEKLNRQKGDNPFFESPDCRSWRHVPRYLWPKNLYEIYDEKSK